MLEAGPRDAPAPTLVLFHGVGEVGTGDYYPVLAQLSRTRRVLGVDQPGFGRSQVKGEDFGPDRLVRAVAEVVAACARGKVDVLGHSSGAALALLYAGHPEHEVRRMVLADAAGLLRPEVLLGGQLHQALTPMREKAPRASKAVQAVGRAMISAVQALVPNAKAIAESGLLGDSPSVRAATALLDYNFGYALERARAPSLILWGEEDQVAPPRIAHMLDDRLPRSQLLFIPDSAHVLMKDQPDRMADAVVKYLSEPVREDEKDDEGAFKSQGNASCTDGEDRTFSGDFDSIEITGCKGFRLHRVRAKQVTVRDSEGRIDESKISAGLLVASSNVSITAGSVEGEVAIEASDSRLDLAGVVLTGASVALRARKDTEVIFSITRLHSPLTNEIMHEAMEIDDARDF